MNGMIIRYARVSTEDQSLASGPNPCRHLYHPSGGEHTSSEKFGAFAPNMSSTHNLSKISVRAHQS